jgi:hypothetical protein
LANGPDDAVEFAMLFQEIRMIFVPTLGSRADHPQKGDFNRNTTYSTYRIPRIGLSRPIKIRPARLGKGSGDAVGFGMLFQGIRMVFVPTLGSRADHP